MEVRRARCIGAALLALLLAGCSSSLKIPRPEAGVSEPPPPVEASEVMVPVTVDLTSIFAEVEKGVPRSDRSSSDWKTVASNPLGDIGLKYEVWRDPLKFDLQKNRLAVGARVYYWFEGAQRITKPFVGGYYWQSLGSCGRGEPPREALIGLVTTVAVQEDWRLKSSTTVSPTQFPKKCTVTFMNIDITARVNDVFKAGLAQAAAMADARLAQQGNLRPYGEMAWKYLQEPIRLDSGLWLTINPVGAQAGPLNGSGKSLTATVGMTAYPRVVIGGRPRPESRPLPKLAAAPPKEGFHITVEGELGFADASRELSRALVGKHYKVSGHDVEITSTQVYGGENKAVVEVGMKGDVDGTIYLLGRPAYDAANNRVYIEDLDFSLETKNVLASAADWLAHGSIRQTIADSAQWYLADQIADIRDRLNRAMNQKLDNNIALRGQVTGIRPGGFFTTPTSFRVRAVVDGALSVNAKF
jgi:hypothetical protein